MRENPITVAIDLIGLTELARRCGVTYPAVRKWERMWPSNVRRVPDVRAIQIEKVTEGRVPKSAIRPDLWPREKAA